MNFILIMTKKITNILLTGGTGMVGKNILEHKQSSKFHFHHPTRQEVDLTNYNLVYEYIKNIDVDLVINCAAHVGGIQASIDNPIDWMNINIEISKNVIMASKNLNIKNLLNFSSSCVYPKDAKNPFEESFILSGKPEPTNEGYAIAKIFSTKLCEYIVREDNSYNYKTIIPCNLYGYYDNFTLGRSHALASIIQKIHSAKKNNISDISIWGDGLARREFLFASDLADFILNAILKFNDLPYLMNVGLGKDFSINEYYQIVADIFHWKGNFIHDLSKPTGIKQKLVSIKLQEEFGWFPQNNVIEGITKTCNFYSNLLRDKKY